MSRPLLFVIAGWLAITSVNSGGDLRAAGFPQQTPREGAATPLPPSPSPQPELMVKKAKIDMYPVQLFGYLLEKLRSTPDGDGSLLDHVAILYDGGLGNGNLHDHRNLPTVLAGGGSGQLKEDASSSIRTIRRCLIFC